jgi:orotidine-5'-phosphate decarboxylase
MAAFAERFVALARARSPLCLGLDPSREVLSAWGLADDAAGLRVFCQTVLDIAGDRVAVIKPQASFFERMGPPGMDALKWALERIRAQGALSLVDAKRGDVADTMEGYGSAFLGLDSGFGGDSMTVNAYLGFGALRPVLDRAAMSDTAVFVVVRSSNPDGCALQNARHDDGRTVAEALADDITAFNAAVGSDLGPVGAVVGATIGVRDAAILSRLPHALILAPGVGAQGASMADVRARFGPAMGRVLPSVSRAILLQGPSPAGLREAVDRYRDAAWQNLDYANRDERRL